MNKARQYALQSTASSLATLRELPKPLAHHPELSYETLPNGKVRIIDTHSEVSDAEKLSFANQLEALAHSRERGITALTRAREKRARKAQRRLRNG